MQLFEYTKETKDGMTYELSKNFALLQGDGAFVCSFCGTKRGRRADHWAHEVERDEHREQLQIRIRAREGWHKERRKRAANKILRGHGRGQPGRDYIEQLLDTGDVDSNADTISVSY